MTHKEAINWLINLSADIGKTEHRDLWHYEQAMDEIREMLESEDIMDAPTIMQWIPCSEQLPENKRNTYWVCTDTESQHECRWTNNKYGLCESDNWGWSIFDIPQYTEVVAWMPLPEPYKEAK